MDKPFKTVEEQVALLESRGMPRKATLRTSFCAKEIREPSDNHHFVDADKMMKPRAS